MNIFQIIFSPTGGTKQVADTITNAWEMPVSKIDLTDAKTDALTLSLNKEDVAFFAVPSYGGRVPALAVQRMAKLHGNQTPCVIVCVYGNRAYEDTLLELKDTVEKNNFKVIGAIAAVAEHSIMHQYAAGRPDAKDKSVLHIFAKQIWKKINDASSDMSTPQIPGNRPYKKAGGAGLIPKSDNKCNSCGLCVKNCPAQAIRQGKSLSTDAKKCISCMRCVVQCPQAARKVNGVMVSIASFAVKKACSVRKENELYI